jgi:hypothetical protein
MHRRQKGAVWVAPTDASLSDRLPHKLRRPEARGPYDAEPIRDRALLPLLETPSLSPVASNLAALAPARRTVVPPFIGIIGPSRHVAGSLRPISETAPRDIRLFPTCVSVRRGSTTDQSQRPTCPRLDSTGLAVRRASPRSAFSGRCDLTVMGTLGITGRMERRRSRNGRRARRCPESVAAGNVLSLRHN